MRIDKIVITVAHKDKEIQNLMTKNCTRKIEKEGKKLPPFQKEFRPHTSHVAHLLIMPARDLHESPISR